MVPSTPRSLALVRRYAVDACRALGWGDSTETVALLTSELATNAVLHAYGAHLQVRVTERGPWLRIEVQDGSTVRPVPRGAYRYAENGRGLLLVEALAANWGTQPAGSGKTTWFEIGR